MDETSFSNNETAPHQARDFDVADLELAILSMYSPGQDPREIERLAEHLRQIQRSPAGWKLADDLLGREDERVKFFGALTFTVKINNDSNDLSDDDLGAIFRRVLVRLLENVDGDSNRSLVVRKLCSAMVAFFLRPNSTWERCLRTLLCTFHHGRLVQEEDLVAIPSKPVDLLQGLNFIQTLAFLWFSQVLAEELSKFDAKSVNSDKTFKRAGANVQELVESIHYLLRQALKANTQVETISVAQEALSTLQAWVKLAPHSWITADTSSQLLASLIPIVIHCTALDDLTSKTLELLSDILKNFSKLLSQTEQRNLVDLLTSDFGSNRVAALRSGDFDEDNMCLAQVVIDYVEFMDIEFAKRIGTKQSETIISYLHSFLRSTGIPAVDDEICVLGINAWINLTELILNDDEVENLLGIPGDISINAVDWLPTIMHHVHGALLQCCHKLRVPSPSALAQLDRDQVAAFGSFRLETHELFENAYHLLRKLPFNVFSTIMGLVQESTRSFPFDWDGLEVDLYCLNIISYFVAEQEEFDEQLISLLETPLGTGLLSVLSNPELGAPPSAPQQLSKTAIRWVGRYTAFFQRHPRFLPSVLDFLFKLLILPSQSSTAASISHNIAESSAKTISTVCDVCRRELVPHIKDLITAFESFRDSPMTNAYIQQKLVSAISTVGQALDRNETKVEFLEYLLPQLGSGARSAQQLFEHGQYEDANNLGVEVLRCLKSVGKAFQEPVDLDDSEDNATFWNFGVGQNIQTEIRGMINIPFALRQSGMPVNIELLHTSLDIVKGGLAENSGPFMLPTPQILDLIRQCNDTDSLSAALSTACALVSAHSLMSSHAIHNEVTLILTHVLEVLEQHKVSPSEEPDLIKEVFEFLNSVLRRYMMVLFTDLQNEAVQSGGKSNTLVNSFLPLVLQSLTIDDSRPKRAAASFLTKILDNTNTAKDPALQASVESWVGQNLNRVLGSLIWNFAGQSSRSHLDFLSPVFTKIMFNYTLQAKGSLEFCLRGPPDGPGFWPETAKASEEEKRMFALTVLGLRGRSGTKQAIERFWVTCRGTAFQYTS